MMNKATEKDSSVVRCLAPSETWFVPIGSYIGYIVKLRGNLDLDALDSALESTRRAHPVLAAYLASSDDTHLLIKSVDPLPGIKVCQGDILDPLAGIEVDPGRVLSAVHVVRDGDRATVTLLIHHAIADARHGLAVLEDFWLSYRDIIEGRQPNLAFHEYPDAVEKILADRGIGKFDYPEPPTEAAIVSSTKSSATNLPEFSNTLLRCRLDDERTAALVEFCRRRQLTINALVSAAIIQVEAEVRMVPLSKIPYVITVDLRQRLSPPVVNTAGTNVLSLVGFTVDHDELGIAELARAISQRLAQELETGEAVYETAKQIGGFANKMLTPAAAQRVFTTNWGAVPALPSPKDLEIDDFQIAIYNKVQDASALIPARSGSKQSYFIYSFQGKLSIELRVTDTVNSDSAQTRIRILSRILYALPAN